MSRKIGIVGSEARKFTPVSEARARADIRALLSPGDVVVSGKCPHGGIDIWSIEEAIKLGLACEEYPPETLDWETGFKPRDILIAERADEVNCLTVNMYPPGYRGKRSELCYHCLTKAHVVSGGCWTVKYAREKLGKPGKIIVIEQG